MSAERPIDIEDKVNKADLILNQTEGSLNRMIKSHGFENGLIDENNCWDESRGEPMLHKGGLESYRFEKDHRRGDSQYYWPKRSVRWVGNDKLCYLLQIYLGEDAQAFILWSIVSKAPFGFPEPWTFQKSTDINLPMPKEPFDQLLEENFQLLSEEGARIKTLIASLPNPHR